MMPCGMVRRPPLLGVAGTALLVFAAGCTYRETRPVNLVISELEPQRGCRVLLWPADDEGVEWSGTIDDPGRAPPARVWRFRLPPTDREPPEFATDVVHISVLLPRDASRRLRHRASFVLERLDAVHPRASLCLVATDSDLCGMDSIADLISVARVDEERRRPPPGHRTSDEGDGGTIFIR